MPKLIKKSKTYHSIDAQDIYDISLKLRDQNVENKLPGDQEVRAALGSKYSLYAAFRLGLVDNLICVITKSDVAVDARGAKTIEDFHNKTGLENPLASLKPSPQNDLQRPDTNDEDKTASQLTPPLSSLGTILISAIDVYNGIIRHIRSQNEITSIFSSTASIAGYPVDKIQQAFANGNIEHLEHIPFDASQSDLTSLEAFLKSASLIKLADDGTMHPNLTKDHHYI